MSALYDFETRNGRLPTPGSASDAAAVLVASKTLAGVEASKIVDSFVETVSKQAAGNLNSMAALYG